MTTFEFSFANNELNLFVVANNISASFAFFKEARSEPVKSRRDINYIKSGHQEPGQDTFFLNDLVEQFLKTDDNLINILDYLNLDPEDKNKASIQETLIKSANNFKH